MSFFYQITFSQIDSTVLGALPPDLRREVMGQLEARQRERHGSSSIRSLSSSSPFRSPQATPQARATSSARDEQQLTDYVPSPQARARAGVGQQSTVGSSGEAPAESTASAAGHNRVADHNRVASHNRFADPNRAAGHNRVRTGAVHSRLEVVREGFDVTAAREGSAKPQQASLGAGRGKDIRC